MNHDNSVARRRACANAYLEHNHARMRAMEGLSLDSANCAENVGYPSAELPSMRAINPPGKRQPSSMSEVRG